MESFVVGVKSRTDTQLSFQIKRMVPLEVNEKIIDEILDDSTDFVGFLLVDWLIGHLVLHQ